MEAPKRFLHDRVVLLMVTVIAILVVIGVSIVLLRFDPSKNPTTTVAYRQNVAGINYQSGKPIDIYSLALFMLLISAGSVYLSSRIYAIRRMAAVFLLASTIFLLILASRVSWSLISLQ
jgi:NADH:ubiquinone oxidoreductase subunit 6 (subunit J)